MTISFSRECFTQQVYKSSIGLKGISRLAVLPASFDHADTASASSSTPSPFFRTSPRQRKSNTATLCGSFQEQPGSFPSWRQSSAGRNRAVFSTRSPCGRPSSLAIIALANSAANSPHCNPSCDDPTRSDLRCVSGLAQAVEQLVSRKRSLLGQDDVVAVGMVGEQVERLRPAHVFPPLCLMSKPLAFDKFLVRAEVGECRVAFRFLVGPELVQGGSIDLIEAKLVSRMSKKRSVPSSPVSLSTTFSLTGAK